MALDKLTKLTTQSGISTTIDYTMSDLIVDTISIGSGGGGIGGGGNINAGIVTCTQLDLNGNGDISGNLVVGGNLTANGDFTTLNTTLREVELLRVDANASVTAGIITQRGSGDILNLFDTNTEVFKIADGGAATFGSTLTIPSKIIHTGDTGTFMNFNTDEIVFETGAASKVFINDAGDLTVGASAGNLGKVYIKQAADTDTEGLAFLNAGGSNSFRLFLGDTSGTVAHLGHGGQKQVNVTQAGKVGIGETTPTSLLHIVDGNTASTPFLHLKGANDKASIRLENTADNPDNIWDILPSISGVSNTGFTIRDVTDSANRLVIDGSGNVGINQTPTRELSVHSPNNNNALIHFTNDDTGETSADGILVGLDGNENMVINNQETGKTINFYNGGSERLRITAAGNLGINNTSPNARIEITDTSTAQIRVGYNATKYARIGRASNGTYEFFSQENGAALVFGTAESSDGGGAEKMRIDRYGRVQIGLSGKTGGDDMGLVVNNPANDGKILELATSASNGRIHFSRVLSNTLNTTAIIENTEPGAQGTGDLRFYTSASSNNPLERLRITSGGNVRIGTQANHSATVQFADSSRDDAVTLKVDNSDDSDFDIVNNRSSGDITVATNSAERLRIDSGGRVLVGHTASQSVYSTSALQVQGTDAATSSLSLLRQNGSPYLSLGATGGSSLGGVTAVSDDDRLGQLTFAGADGTDVNTHACSIAGYVDGSVSGNTVPGRLVFATSTGPGEVERLRITSDGAIVAASASGYHGDADDLVLKERSGGNVGITLLNTGTGYGVLYFGDNSDNNAGRIQYDHSSDSFDLFTGGAERFILTNVGATFKCSTSSTLTYAFQNETSGASADTKLLVKAYSNSGADPYIKFDAGGTDMVVGVKYEGSANNKLLLGPGASPNGGVTGISIDGGGRTRIGGNSATAITDFDVVRANSTITDAMLVKGNTGNSFIRFQDNDNSCNWSMGGDDGGGFGANAFIWYDRVAGRYVFSIDGAGQVNVGNARPGSGAGAFNVRTHGTVDAFVKFRNASDFGAYTGSAIDCRTSNNVTSRDLVIRSNNLALWNPSAETFRFDANGRLHVGYNASSNSGTAALNIVGAGHGIQVARIHTGSQPTNGQDLGSIAFQGYLAGNSTASADARIDAAAVENHSGSSAGTNLRFWTKQVGTGPGSSPDLWCILGSHGIFNAKQGVDTQSSNNSNFYSPANTGYVGTQWTEQGAGFVFYMGELASGSSSNASSQYVTVYSSHHWGDYPRLIIWAHERYYRTSFTTWTFGGYGGGSPSASLTQTESWGGTNGGHGTDNAGSVSASHQGSIATYSGSAVHKWELTMSNTGNYGYTRWYIGVLRCSRGIYTSASTASNVDASCSAGGCVHLKTVNNSQMRNITYLTA